MAQNSAVFFSEQTANANSSTFSFLPGKYFLLISGTYDTATVALQITDSLGAFVTVDSQTSALFAVLDLPGGDYRVNLSSVGGSTDLTVQLRFISASQQ